LAPFANGAVFPTSGSLKVFGPPSPGGGAASQQLENQPAAPSQLEPPLRSHFNSCSAQKNNLTHERIKIENIKMPWPENHQMLRTENILKFSQRVQQHFHFEFFNNP